ncbi:MAG: PEP-CTERM sorting domain-containing protein [Alphaproteobacteria bacterium]|nr:MAG: PEP-CTERM sorting domain-containing protein [Alphaproteobacteria bacterium]
MKKLMLATAFLLGLGHAAGAVTVFSDNFNGESVGQNVTLSKWQVRQGSVDVLGPGLGSVYSGTGKYVDLGGSTNKAGTIRTRRIKLVKGATYRLSFDVGVAGTKPERLVFGLYRNVRYALKSPKGGLPAMKRVSRTFTATSGAGWLFFKGFGRDNSGALIDNVRLRKLSPPQPVPVPAALGLFATAIAGLGLIGLRRRRS